MDVLKAVEDEAVESRSRGPEFESLCANKINELVARLFYFLMIKEAWDVFSNL